MGCILIRAMRLVRGFTSTIALSLREWELGFLLDRRSIGHSPVLQSGLRP